MRHRTASSFGEGRAGTIFEQTKTGLAVVPRHLPRDLEQGRHRRHGAAAADGLRQLPDRLELAAQDPQGDGPAGSQPLSERVEADETYVGGARPGRPGRGAAGKALVAGAVESRPRQGPRAPARPAAAGRLPDAGARSLEGFLAANVAKPAAVATDGWSGYAGLPPPGYDHEPINLSASWGDAVLRLPAIHLVFGLAKRWLLGTHHGAVGKKHLPAYLDEYVFRFNRRTAKSISHRFALAIGARSPG